MLIKKSTKSTISTARSIALCKNDLERLNFNARLKRMGRCAKLHRFSLKKYLRMLHRVKAFGVGKHRVEKYDNKTRIGSRKTGFITRTSSSLLKKITPCESPMGVRQNPWTPTKRRGPIAAEAASPGPAVVSLPSLIGKPPPESRRARAPAFSFGQKLEPPGTSSKAGPGPASYNTEGMTAKGRAVGPAASLHGRWPPLRVAPTPAPCDYEPNKAARVVLDHAPAFSIGLRVSVPLAGGKTPAPNTYSMPPVLGEAKEGGKRAAPAFSITGRRKSPESNLPLPGPGSYTTDKAATVLTRRSPAFTMAPRREVKPPTATVPGPGVYCPEKVCVTLPWAPAHTFGIRHSPYTGQAVHYPAPEEIAAV